MHQVTFVDQVTKGKESIEKVNYVECHKLYNELEWYQCPELRLDISSANKDINEFATPDYDDHSGMDVFKTGIFFGFNRGVGTDDGSKQKKKN